jgi:hypothetical protein
MWQWLMVSWRCGMKHSDRRILLSLVHDGCRLEWQAALLLGVPLVAARLLLLLLLLLGPLRPLHLPGLPHQLHGWAGSGLMLQRLAILLPAHGTGACRVASYHDSAWRQILVDSDLRRRHQSSPVLLPSFCCCGDVSHPLHGQLSVPQALCLFSDLYCRLQVGVEASGEGLSLRQLQRDTEPLCSTVVLQHAFLEGSHRLMLLHGYPIWHRLPLLEA